MRIDESRLADAALNALDDERICELSGEPLDVYTRQCAWSVHAHCPFCGRLDVSDLGPCVHWLATWDSETGYSGLPLPRPPGKLRSFCAFPESQKKAAFDDLYDSLCPIFDECVPADEHPADSFRARLNENALTSRLIGWVAHRLTDIELLEFYSDGPGGAYGDVLYTRRPEPARAQAQTLVERVHAAFERLGNLT